MSVISVSSGVLDSSGRNLTRTFVLTRKNVEQVSGKDFFSSGV